MSKQNTVKSGSIVGEVKATVKGSLFKPEYTVKGAKLLASMNGTAENIAEIRTSMAENARAIMALFFSAQIAIVDPDSVGVTLITDSKALKGLRLWSEPKPSTYSEEEGALTDAFCLKYTRLLKKCGHIARGRFLTAIGVIDKGNGKTSRSVISTLNRAAKSLGFPMDKSKDVSTKDADAGETPEEGYNVIMSGEGSNWSDTFKTAKAVGVKMEYLVALLKAAYKA